MNPELPKLAFVPVNQLLAHERHDNQRMLPLIKRIRMSGVFRNPPIVAPLQDGTDRYMILDGANRISALRVMEYPDALVQVVEPDDPGLRLQNWNHIVWELSPKRFIKGLRAIPNTSLQKVDVLEISPSLEAEGGLAVIQTAAMETFIFYTHETELVARVLQLNAIVDSYRERARLDRTNLEDLTSVQHIYPNLSGLVNFPEFKIHELLKLAGEGHWLPAGITRFTISPRALHVNYPLEALKADLPVAEKNAELENWLRERLEHKSVRYYAEATFLFDE